MVVVLVLSVSLFGEFKIVEHVVGCSATMSLQKKMWACSLARNQPKGMMLTLSHTQMIDAFWQKAYV